MLWGGILFKKMDYVYAVYKEKSFTKAAEKLYISQPCLSAAVKKIEDEIGMALFERKYNTVVLTETGKKYIEAAEKIMRAQLDFLSEVNDVKNLEKGSIIIGAPNYPVSYILPDIINAFSKKYPKINIVIIEANSVELLKKLREGSVDLIIDSFDNEISMCDYFPLFNEKILLAVPKENKCNNNLQEFRILPDDIFSKKISCESVKQIRLNKFFDEEFILLKEGHSMLNHAMKVFKKYDFTPKVKFRFDQLSTSYTFTRSGNGISFVTDTMFKYHKFSNDVFLYNLRDAGERTMYIVRSKENAATFAGDKFIEFVSALFCDE